MQKCKYNLQADRVKFLWDFPKPLLSTTLKGNVCKYEKEAKGLPTHTPHVNCEGPQTGKICQQNMDEEDTHNIIRTKPPRPVRSVYTIKGVIASGRKHGGERFPRS